MTIPYGQIDTVFLDVGNTLISIDFSWVADELAARHVHSDTEALRRAEAAARPAFSQRTFVDGIPAGTDVFHAYLMAILGGIPATAALPRDRFLALVSELRQVLRPDGRASVLWRSVMPGVPDALARLRSLGLTLAVVSNSDGTAEESLEAAGLRPFFTRVIDSALAGFEKPDPRIFAHALTQVDARAERTLHVGDLYHADVAGAREAGLHAILLDPYGDWPEMGCPRARDVSEVADRLAAAR